MTSTAQLHSQCVRCATELPPHALVCPACATLVHGEKLRGLAAVAESAAEAGDLQSARESWETALRFLPEGSQQYLLIKERVTDLAKRIQAETPASARAPNDAPWWRRGIAGVVAIGLLFVSKLKFLLLGLTKASTFISMLGFLGVYWGLYGWRLALGIVVSIYIHEMGHVAMLRRLGIGAGAPLFIPGVGAFVMLKEHVTDPVTDAKIGLAGPVWGLGAGLTAAGMFALTRAPIWWAIAQLTGMLNLFNLIPVWQLDGSRAFHALSRTQRWAVVAAIAIALLLTQQKLLYIVGAVAIYRASQKQVGPGNNAILATFVVLIGSLAWLARGVGN